LSRKRSQDVDGEVCNRCPRRPARRHRIRLKANAAEIATLRALTILALCLIYVEAIACFLKGESSRGKSREFFKFGLIQIILGMNAFIGQPRTTAGRFQRPHSVLFE